MGGDRPKQYLAVGDRLVIEHSVQTLLEISQLSRVLVGIQATDRYWNTVDRAIRKKVQVSAGGSTRAETVMNALALLSTSQQANPQDWVLVHDAVRPCVSKPDIVNLIEQSIVADGGLLGCEIVDSIKRVDTAGRVINTESEATLWRALTPQMFRLGALQNALLKAIADGVICADEAAAMARLGFKPVVVRGNPSNIKITRPEDLRMAIMILQQCQ